MITYGDEKGEITLHEVKLIRFYERNYARVKCHEHPVYCEENTKEGVKVRYLLSSTSAKWNGRVIQNRKDQGENIHLADYESLYSMNIKFIIKVVAMQNIFG